ncbi:MAG: CDP-alcohol phosphatidyltransferase family protein [Candidatus Atabeyarchaeum deiterrae]
MRVRGIFRPLVNSIATLFIRLKLTPNMITVFGALLASITPFLMAKGDYFAFGVTVFLVGLMDGVDGAIARITSKTTQWGGFLDSMLDRYGDAIIVLSYIFNPITTPLGGTIVLGVQFRIWVCIGMVGSLMVSYTRAKSEATGVKKSDIGVAARSERLLIVSITGILGIVYEYIMIYGLIIVAILANFTALHRAAHAYASLKNKDAYKKVS